MPETKKTHISPALILIQLAFSKLGPLFPNLMGKWAYRLWFTTARFKTPAHEASANNTAQRTTLNVNNTPVSVLSWGKAPFILFIHGWSGRGSQAAPFLDKLVSAGYGVISFDGPAHGKTPGKQTNILEMADVVLALDNKFGPFEAAITHFFGGMIVAYTMKLGVKFNKVVCICPPDDLQVLIDNFKQTLTIPDSVIKVMLNRLEKNYGNDLAERISTVNNVKRLNNKALIIHDENDDDVPVQSGQVIAKAWADSLYIQTQGLGHRRILRDPDVVKSVTDFITR